MQGDALKELESKALFLNPDSFKLNSSLSQKAFELLNRPEWFQDRYRISCGKLSKQFPLYRKFYPDFIGQCMSDAADCTGWLCIFDLLPDHIRTNQLHSTKTSKFDTLALLFYDIRESLSEKITRKTEPVLKQWCAVIASTILSIIETELNHESVKENVVMFVKVESFILRLILGFCSEAMEEFHDTVRSIVDESILSSFPKSISCTSVRSTARGESSQERMLALTLSKRNRAAGRGESRRLFEYQQQTPLVTRALELHGVLTMPPHKKAYAKTDVIRDDTEYKVKVYASVERCHELGREHRKNKKDTLKDLCRTQSEWAVRIAKTEKGGSDLANSPIGSVMFYQKLEADMRARQAETQADQMARLKQEPPVKLDLSQFEPDIAWAIAEDSLVK